MSGQVPMRRSPEDRILETPRPLPESALWALNERFFLHAGPEAWSRVPDYVTTNPWNARIQADLAFGFLQDLAAEGITGPVTIVELASGPGRFGYHFHRALRERLRDARIDLQVRLVLTDLVDSNLDVARQHPLFADAFARGEVAAVAWDTQSPEPPLPMDGPVVVLANYAFDGVPNAAFVVEDGLHELHMGLAIPADADPSDPLLLDHISVQWEVEPAPRDTRFEPLLDFYAQHLTGAFTVPVAGLDLLDRVRAWSPHTLVVVADKGVHRLGDLGRQDLPRIARHGSISMTVNLHAMTWWHEHQGGQALSARHAGEGLDTVALVRGVDAVALRRAYRRWEDLDAATFRSIRGMLPDGPFTPRQALAYLRFTGHEPQAFRRVASSLEEAILEGRASPPSVAEALGRVAEASYGVQGYDLDFDLGRLWFALGDFARGADYFERSAERTPSASTWSNLATCAHFLGDRERARAALERALALDPAHASALRVRGWLDA